MAAPDPLRPSLRFLSGRHQGSDFVLDDPSEVVVGRSGDADLILVEGMVSRRHARFELSSGTLRIEDLGSTNGTFVNGDKVKHATLREGDRVLIGTTILKVAFSELPLGTRPPPPLGLLDEGQTADRTGMAGRLDDVNVPELIEMFSSARQRVLLEIDGPDGKAELWIVGGRVLDCRILRLPSAPALKCIHRLLGYESGTFAVKSFRAPERARLDVPAPELLVDGLFKLDETASLRRKLPGEGQRLALAKPLLAPLSQLEEPELDLLQIAHNHGEVATILDETPQTDLEASKWLLALIDRGYLRKV
ncbi:MAG: FHA domain-containing protein [Myxococcales bacterium]|nr:FHA domain-containing protein [Myxococcales bacterium]